MRKKFVYVCPTDNGYSKMSVDNARQSFYGDIMNSHRTFIQRFTLRDEFFEDPTYILQHTYTSLLAKCFLVPIIIVLFPYFGVKGSMRELNNLMFERSRGMFSSTRLVKQPVLMKSSGNTVK